MRHINHVASMEVVAAARAAGLAIATEDLTCIRKRIKAGLRVWMRLHRGAFRQVKGFVAYRAAALGLATVFTDPPCTSKACSQ